MGSAVTSPLQRYDCRIHTTSGLVTPQEERLMARRTVNLPDSVDAMVREMAKEGESFSAAVTRLLLAGAASVRGKKPPSYVGSGEGPPDLSERVEEYLREIVLSE
jgi:hypothetical protein